MFRYFDHSERKIIRLGHQDSNTYMLPSASRTNELVYWSWPIGFEFVRIIKMSPLVAHVGTHKLREVFASSGI